MNKDRIKNIKLLKKVKGDICNLQISLSNLMHFNPSLFDNKNYPYYNYIRDEWNEVWTTWGILQYVRDDISNVLRNGFNIIEEEPKED